MWKITKDTYYRGIPENLLAEAGFFEDTSTELEPITKGSTPKPLYTDLPNQAVLVYTGSFCPLHNGHIDTLTKAKKCAEDHGYNIIAGYISTGHDEYVYNKTNGYMDAYQRINDMLNKTRIIPWIIVDPWEALERKVAVNFTDVLEHIQLVVGPTVKVIYVCGGDCERFSLTFMHKGYCIVVSRPGYPQKYKDHPLNQHGRVLWVEGDSKESSSNMRKTLTFSLPRTL